jgi:hypothetical protein
MMKKRVLFFGISALLILSAVFFTGCPTTNDPVKSSENRITSFTLHDISGTINDETGIITVILPEGTSKTGTPLIEVSENAAVDKSGEQDFNSDVSYTVTAENGAARTYTVTVYVPSPVLENTVYGGLTPQANGTGWLTLAFKADYKVTAAFNADNSTNEWEYAYDVETGNGTITVASGWNPAPNGFTLSTDTKTLTITNYGSHGGFSRDFMRLRQGDAGLTVEPSPAGLPALPADLVLSVFGGSTPQDSGKGWLSISFKANNKAIFSFSADNTTNEWEYTYNAGTKTGTITNPGGGWNPAPNGFTMSDDGNTLTITNYGSHSGGARTFNRYSTILSSENSITAFTFNIPGEDLTINQAESRVTVLLPRDIEDISGLTPVITVSDKASLNPGTGQDFTSDVNYTVTAEDGTDKNWTVTVSSLSTEWRWNTVVLEFKADNKVYADSLEYGYSYNNTTKAGEISGDTNRRGGASAENYPIVNNLGPFTINGDILTFSNYRESGTSVIFSRRMGTVSGNDLAGTSWRFSRPSATYDASKNMIGVLWYGPNFVIECLDNTNAILYAIDGYYTAVSKLTYTYTDAGQTGSMTFVSGPLNGTPGPFTVRSPHTFSPYFEDFSWRGGNKNNFNAAHNLAFSNWKSYGHGWDFVKMDTNGIDETKQ